MAKLNVVIPAVEVTVDGVAYRKVDRKAQAGDIIRFDGETDVDEITSGGFYMVNRIDSFGAARITDDYGDDDYDTAGEDFEVYAPVSEPTPQTITFEGATWRKVDRVVREGDAIKFTDEDRDIWLTDAELYVVDRVDSCDDPQITDDDGDDYDAGSEDYEVYEKVAVEKAETVVERKANAGDRVRIVARLRVSDPYNNGDVLTVIKRLDSHRVTLSVNGESAIALDDEFVVLEPVTAEPAKKAEPERLAVGDYARVVERGHHAFNYGDIVEIIGMDDSDVPYRAKALQNGRDAWTATSRLVRATDEEVADAKDPRSKFEIGDYAKVAVEYCKHKVGDVLNITNTASRHDFYVTNVATSRLGCIDADKLVKLTAAEIAEIERKQAEEAAKRAEEAEWNAIGRKVNEFKVGDIVECTGSHGGHAIGTIGIIVYDASSYAKLRVKANGEVKSHIAQMRLIVPVEQRFDRSADVATEEVDAA